MEEFANSWSFSKHFLISCCFRWKKVGEVTDLLCYPIKSGRAIHLEEFECEPIGLRKGQIRDRVFMVINKDGKFITGAMQPKLVLVSPKIEGDLMTLSAPGMIDLFVDIERLFTFSPTKATIFGQTVDTIDVGEESSRWFSRFILQEDFGLRLVFYPMSYPTRDVLEKHKILPAAIPEDTGALHNTNSFMMINETSVAELNTRIANPVASSQFRPNIVIRAQNAFEEDAWKYIKIGDETIFKSVRPCTR